MEICAGRSLLKVLLMFIALPVYASPSRAAETANSCLDCHTSAAKMSERGYPHFSVTPEEVRQQSGMPAG